MLAAGRTPCPWSEIWLKPRALTLEYLPTAKHRDIEWLFDHILLLIQNLVWRKGSTTAARVRCRKVLPRGRVSSGTEDMLG